MPTFKRTMQDLDGKIAQEQPKEAPKPVEPKQYNPAKEFKPKPQGVKMEKPKAEESEFSKSRPAFTHDFAESLRKDAINFANEKMPYDKSLPKILNNYTRDEVIDFMRGNIGEDEIMKRAKERNGINQDRVNLLAKQEAQKQPQPQKFEFGADPTDPDLERSYGPTIKSVAYRGEDIAKAKEAGWSDDDIIDALLEQDYDEDEAIDFVTKYDPKRFKDPATNPARSYEAWEEARKAESAARMGEIRKEFPKFVTDLTEIHANDEDKYFDEDAIRDNIYEMGVGELGEDEIEQLTKELSEAMQKAGFENATKNAKYILPKEEPNQEAPSKMQALSQHFGGEEYKPTSYDESIFENRYGEEYLVATEEEAYDRAKDEVRSFIEDEGIEYFSDQFKDWIISSAVSDDFIRELRDEEVDYYRGEGENEIADQIANMNDDNLIQYYIDNLGEKEFFDIIKKNNGFDIDRIIEEAISWDGVPHFISRYDGEEIELPNGYFAYRLN